MDTEALFTVREAAGKIGVSESAIRNATLEGRLPFVVKFGRKLIEQDALAAYKARTQPRGVKSRGRPYETGGAIPAAAPDGSADEGAASSARRASENASGNSDRGLTQIGP